MCADSSYLLCQDRIFIEQVVAGSVVATVRLLSDITDIYSASSALNALISKTKQCCGPCTESRNGKEQGDVCKRDCTKSDCPELKSMGILNLAIDTIQDGIETIFSTPVSTQTTPTSGTESQGKGAGGGLPGWVISLCLAAGAMAVCVGCVGYFVHYERKVGLMLDDDSSSEGRCVCACTCVKAFACAWDPVIAGVGLYSVILGVTRSCAVCPVIASVIV